MPADQTQILDPRSSLRLLGADLVVVDGPERGKRLRVTQGVAQVGRALSAHLSLSDTAVSRIHCEVRVRGDAVRLIDNDSTNGTFVDGTRVRDAEVSERAVVRIGISAFRIEIGEEPEYVALSSNDRFGAVLGASAEMRRVYAVLERIAPTDATVLLLGETGTGKEVVAQAMHDASRRASGPFVALDCGALSESLIESELFGHVRGAFTSAVTDREGAFEQANGGTLFLDEIGELTLAQQRKLLRALETRSVRRVGGNASTAVDVRVIAATNRALARAVNEGEFREDLYYRLAVVELHLPPLRNRREDIRGLAEHFAERFTGAPAVLPAEFVASLARKSWPGNVRELRNFIERSVALGALGVPAQHLASAPRHDPVVISAQLPLHLPLKDARAAWLAQFEELYVRTLLAKTGGNVTHAAAQAGINRRFLQRLIARLDIRSIAPSSEDEGLALTGPGTVA